MSWLYTIIVAGLVFAAEDVNVEQFHHVPETQPAISVQKDVTEKFEQTLQITPNGRISLSNINGSIVIEAWDRSEVHVEALKVADSEETLGDVEIKIDSRHDSLQVRTEYERWGRTNRDRNRHSKLEVRYKLSVPRNARLDQIETVNGSVNVSDLSNVTKISAVNGNVTATNLSGSADLGTVNGVVKADFDRVATAARISLNSVNGQIELTLPSDVSATLKADTLHGAIKNDFGIPVHKGQFIGQGLNGRVGSGEAQIKLNSVNGSLTISRKKDGRAINQVVDLGQQLQGRDPKIDRAVIERETARAAAEVRKAVVDAKKIAAETGKISAEQLAKLKELEKLGVEVSNEDLKEVITEGIAAGFGSFVWSDMGWGASPPSINQHSRSYSVKDKPKVSVQGSGCSVTVRSWGRSEVRYLVSETISRTNIVPVDISEKQNGDDLELEVRNETGAAFARSVRDMPVRVDIYVPRNADINVSTDGHIRVTGISGNLDLKGDDGQIDVRESSGRLALRSSDGRVRVIGFNGELDLNAEDAEVSLEGDFSSIRSVAVDASIILTLPENINARLLSSTPIQMENISAKKVHSGELLFGSGGPTFDFRFDEQGRLVVRGLTTLGSL